MSNSANSRTKRQREARTGEGWQLVSVWVPSVEDAADVRAMAAERRQRAERLEGLSREVRSISLETEFRIARAIAEFGSRAYITPTGAVLDLMTELANEDDLEGFSKAVVILARAKPANAPFVRAAVPGKISNFLIRHRNVDPGALFRWTQANPGWVLRLEQSVSSPTLFPSVVEGMADAIKCEEI